MVERRPSQNSKSTSTSNALNENIKVDVKVDSNRAVHAFLTRRQYQIYFYLIKKRLFQITIAKKLKISKQAVNKHVKNLEILGVIKPIKRDANPKFFKTTSIIPATKFAEGRQSRITINKYAKIPERRIGKSIKTVRDHKTGHFKGKKEGRGEGFKRDYDTIVSMDGKRIPMFRVNAISYSCTILNVPAVNVPWEKKKGPRGMEQWVLRHELSDKKSSLKELKRVEITFMRKKTASTDELVIYLPEKYLLRYELEQAEKILQEYVWKARKWFQNTFKAYLSMPIQYRPMEIAREIVDPALKHYVQENGMVKVKTRRGYAIVDESKKGFPEKEYTTREQVEIDLNSADEILDLKEQMYFMMEQQKKTNEMIQNMAEAQKQFHTDIQEFMGFRKKMEKRLEKDGTNMFG